MSHTTFVETKVRPVRRAHTPTFKDEIYMSLCYSIGRRRGAARPRMLLCHSPEEGDTTRGSAWCTERLTVSAHTYQVHNTTASGVTSVLAESYGVLLGRTDQEHVEMSEQVRPEGLLQYQAASASLT